MKLWLNGQLIDASEARIDPTDRGFTLGDGLFESLKVCEGQPLRLAAHLRRLQAGADALAIPLPFAPAVLTAAMTAVITANAVQAGLLRLTLSRGPAPRGLAIPAVMRPTLLILAAPAAPPAPPARAIIARCTRRNEFSPLARFKTLNYLDNVLARREADQNEADEALLLNSQGRLCESTVANLFLVIDSTVLTPPIEEGALPGVMRAEIIDRLGAKIQPLDPGDLGRASEAFLTNANGARALVMVDGKPIGDGQPGPVTLGLHQIK